MTTKYKLTFALEMGRQTRATVRQCEALLRFAQTYRKVLEWERCEPHKIKQYQAKRLRIANKMGDICREIECPVPTSVQAARAGLIPSEETDANHPVPVFTGPVLKIRTPGGGEIVCPS